MTVRRAIVAAVVVLIIALVVWRWSALPPARLGEAKSASAKTSTASLQAAAVTQSAIGNRASAIAERSTLADALNSPATDIHGDLRLVSEIVATFRTNFPHDGNPAGNNAEITAALTGRNKLRLALIPPDHPAINQAGELCDRWETPFFFHAESATRMEIRSAGPDKKMWSDDDVALSP